MRIIRRYIFETKKILKTKGLRVLLHLPTVIHISLYFKQRLPPEIGLCGTSYLKFWDGKSDYLQILKILDVSHK
jgi:hypothetical protein